MTLRHPSPNTNPLRRAGEALFKPFRGYWLIYKMNKETDEVTLGDRFGFALVLPFWLAITIPLGAVAAIADILALRPTIR